MQPIPLVSVNITTYNRAALLPRCLDSVLGQTYTNLELIIVDDFSTDNTSDVVNSYKEKDQRIKYIRHDRNLGNAFARNTAIANGTGQYIAFMDDDDEWIDNDKITRQVTLFEQSNDKKLGIICSSVRLFSDKNTFKDKIIQKPHDLINMILKGNGYIYSPTVMTKRLILEEVGRFDTRLPRGIDSDFYRMCIVKFGYNVHFMEDITTAVHEHGNDRMSPQRSMLSLKKSILSHWHALIKYFKFYLLHPSALYVRVKMLLQIVLLYIKGKVFNVHN